MKIGILLTVHNRLLTTLACLNRIKDVPKPPGCSTKVYVTVDGCTDGTGEAIRSNFPEVVQIIGDGSLFWNRGMISAWNRAAQDDCDFYLWLNDDTLIYDDTIISLFEMSKRKNHESIIVGACEHNGKFTYGGKKEGNIFAQPEKGKDIQVQTFNGNIVWVPKSVFLLLGTMDPYYRHRWGDVEYGLRAKRYGITSFMVDHYLGDCERHQDYSKWCNPKYSVFERLKAIHKPNGLIPREVYHFEKKYVGYFPALCHYFTVYLRCLFPSIWIKSGKAKVKI